MVQNVGYSFHELFGESKHNDAAIACPYARRYLQAWHPLFWNIILEKKAVCNPL
jgi:hypothetical protein